MNQPHVGTGMVMHDKITGITFRVLCNCSGARPREHTERFVKANYEKRFVKPTKEQLKAFHGEQKGNRQALLNQQSEAREQVQKQLKHNTPTGKQHQSPLQAALQRMRKASYTQENQPDSEA